MRSVVVALESERDGLQRLLAEERRHGHGVETLLGSARAKDAAASEQVRKMARENAGLQTLINEQNFKLKAMDETFSVMAKTESEADVDVDVSEGVAGAEGGADEALGLGEGDEDEDEEEE